MRFSTGSIVAVFVALPAMAAAQGVKGTFGSAKCDAQCVGVVTGATGGSMVGAACVCTGPCIGNDPCPAACVAASGTAGLCSYGSGVEGQCFCT